MSTNGINVCEDAEMADCDGEKVVTMMDVLKEQEDFEDDANAVLGASDDKNCTYSKGYVKRQAIYACMSCCTNATDDPTKWAGVCLACSLNCHENHELIELYTKRNFRCDCGNPKLNTHPCQFTPTKTDLNVENIYNQNFSGVYCICHRPYPDPDSSTQGDMIQCIICEDWLHSNHLDAAVPPNDQYSEMICKMCMDKNEFLHDYSNLAVNKDDMDVDILNTNSETSSVINCNSNFHAETDGNESIVKADSDVNEQIEKDNAAVTNDKDEIIEHNTTESVEEQVSMKEGQNNIESSENEETPSELALKEKDMCKLENKNKSEGQNISQDAKTSTDATHETIDNTIEKQSSVAEKDGTEPVHANTADSRSQEQVEEDLLLADPMDTDIEQTEDVGPSNATALNKDSTSEVIGETSESVSEDQVKNAEDHNEVQNTSKSDSTLITKQSGNAAISEVPESVITKSKDVSTVEELENMATDEKTDNLPTAGQSDHIVAAKEVQNMITSEEAVTVMPVAPTDGKSTTDFSESEETDSSIKSKHPDSMHTADASKTAPISEQSDGTSITKESENTDRSEKVPEIERSGDVTTTEQLELHTKNDHIERNSLESENNISHENEKSVDIVTNDPANNDTENDKKIDSTGHNEPIDGNLETDILKRKLSSDGDIKSLGTKKQKLDENKCVRPSGVKKMYHGATFWPSHFRQKLCTCNECISMYKDLSVLFLIDPEDTVTAYETLGKEKTDGKPASQYEKGMAALSSLGRVQQINALTEYTKLRDKLLDFLKTFKDKKVIVKEEDIKAFFAGMKPVREPDGVYFCR